MGNWAYICMPYARESAQWKNLSMYRVRLRQMNNNCNNKNIRRQQQQQKVTNYIEKCIAVCMCFDFNLCWHFSLVLRSPIQSSSMRFYWIFFPRIFSETEKNTVCLCVCVRFCSPFVLPISFTHSILIMYCFEHERIALVNSICFYTFESILSTVFLLNCVCASFPDIFESFIFASFRHNQSLFKL